MVYLILLLKCQLWKNSVLFNYVSIFCENFLKWFPFFIFKPWFLINLPKLYAVLLFFLCLVRLCCYICICVWINKKINKTYSNVKATFWGHFGSIWKKGCWGSRLLVASVGLFWCKGLQPREDVQVSSQRCEFFFLYHFILFLYNKSSIPFRHVFKCLKYLLAISFNVINLVLGLVTRINVLILRSERPPFPQHQKP